MRERERGGREREREGQSRHPVLLGGECQRFESLTLTVVGQ